jgi:hypothetical protein
MGDSRGIALMMPLNMMASSRVDMADMSVGGDRRELNDDQKDRHSNHPQKCSGRVHAHLLLYDPVEVNNG